MNIYNTQHCVVDNERVINHFLQLVKINAPSRQEQALADYLIPLLKKMGFSIQFDYAHKKFEGECGNLIAYWPGNNPTVPPLFFSTHLDTVLPTEGLTTIVKEGVIYSDGTTILGADDRAALAAYLEGIQIIQENNYTCGPIELILTVNEQTGLVGSAHLDYALVKSRQGYVFDSSGDVGQIIIKGPYSSRIYCDIEGKSSHIGLNPEDGINAFLIAADALLMMKLGKINASTLSNIGLINGGELTSIIPGTVTLSGEVRSFTEKGLINQLEDMKSVLLHSAAQYGGIANVHFEKKYLGFSINENELLTQNALSAAKMINISSNVTETLGGADTNNFNEHGLICLTLGNGFRNIHTFNEHISIENLVNAARYTVALILQWQANHT